MESRFAERWIRKFRILTLSLIFSCALNVGLIAALVSFLLPKREPILSYFSSKTEETPPEASSNMALLKTYEKLSFRELSAILTNDTSVEEGYRKCDLALSALVSFRHFNLEKALGGCPAQCRILKWEGAGSIKLFPGLNHDQFQAIIRFAYLEKWPLTGEGLFALLKKTSGARDPTLEQAFALTPEFHALQTLFQKCETSSSSKALIDLALDGTWSMLDAFVKEQSQMLDLSDEKRRRLLLSYLALSSPSASQLILQTDFLFALKRLDDKGILDLLQQCKEMNEQLHQFCLELLKSSRSDAIWMKCAALLYQHAGKEMPQPFERSVALAQFVRKEPVAVPSLSIVAAVAPSSVVRRTHLVQEGESLWKIARQYKVTLDELVALNGLEKNKIRTGMVLQIP